MSTFSIVLLVTGSFLVIYAAVALRGKRGAEGHRRESLGCGFVILAGLVWGLALSRYLGGWSRGFRLGLAAALVIPALVALTNPRRGRALIAVAFLGLAVVLAAPSVPLLLQKVNRTESAATVADVDAAISELRTRIQATQSYIEKLADDRAELKSKIKAQGFDSFDDLAADPQGYELLQELSRLDQRKADTETRLESMRAQLPRMESARRQLERLAEGERATGVAVSTEEIDQLLREAQEEPQPSGPTTVEEHVQREQLKDLYEREF